MHLLTSVTLSLNCLTGEFKHSAYSKGEGKTQPGDNKTDDKCYHSQTIGVSPQCLYFYLFIYPTRHQWLGDGLLDSILATSPQTVSFGWIARSHNTKSSSCPSRLLTGKFGEFPIWNLILRFGPGHGKGLKTSYQEIFLT